MLRLRLSFADGKTQSSPQRDIDGCLRGWQSSEARAPLAEKHQLGGMRPWKRG
jgi:hypothetical protein